jgi:hypothetical protein
MAKPNPLDYLQLWTAALEQEIGLVIEVADPQQLRRLLYEARTLSPDPRLQDVIMFLPASGDRIFLARKSVELEA